MKRTKVELRRAERMKGESEDGETKTTTEI